MEELVKQAVDKIEAIDSATSNTYINKMCGIISIKLEDINSRRYSLQETVADICDNIVQNDIVNMKGVLGLEESIYVELAELMSIIAEIPQKY